ncbi:hypothetical protein Lal_00047431 [Lupinus albus]|uniref:Putative transcription factor C2H2 family n=1 Tax=Lupinus albus TaxID=3870 RepID=A0A6A4QZA0_LUPAL|nr:putative transcription factor C2H2 family [Lupinus albus]KAF1878759.1 hypothetical protein Lal_00047431 [Lupinus albus]
MANNNINNFNNFSVCHDQLGNPRYTCRVCNTVFNDPVTFIRHIESHVTHESVAMRMLRRNFNRSMLNQETRNLDARRVPQSLPQQHTFMPQTRPRQFHYTPNPIQPRQFQPVLPSSRNIVREVPPLFTPQIQQQMGMEVSPIDGTKPYINLLDKPINKNEFANMLNMSGENLDLTLRL